MFNASSNELPRALQHLLAREADAHSPAAAELPRRAFLKLGAASGFALGVFPVLAQARRLRR
jgi:isoquinoline 1-oxidoreductase beta subunit